MNWPTKEKKRVTLRRKFMLRTKIYRSSAWGWQQMEFNKKKKKRWVWPLYEYVYEKAKAKAKRVKGVRSIENKREEQRKRIHWGFHSLVLLSKGWCKHNGSFVLISKFDPNEKSTWFILTILIDQLIKAIRSSSNIDRFVLIENWRDTSFVFRLWISNCLLSLTKKNASKHLSRFLLTLFLHLNHLLRFFWLRLSNQMIKQRHTLIIFVRAMIQVFFIGRFSCWSTNEWLIDELTQNESTRWKLRSKSLVLPTMSRYFSSLQRPRRIEKDPKT